MRGTDHQQSHIFSYLSPESRVRKDHPLRAIRTMVDEVLGRLSPQFDRMYASEGRPSIAPEKLLRAQVLQMLYSIRSERLLVCLESRRLLAGASPVVVIAREPRSRLPVLPGDWRC
jgi:transposase